MLSFPPFSLSYCHWSRSTDVRATSELDYEWAGEFEDYYGAMNVISENGNIRAHISYDGKEYGIYPLEDGIHAVVRLLLPDSTFQGGCGLDAIRASSTEDHEEEPPSENGKQGYTEGESSREAGCLENSVRVLVLHTARARATGFNPQQEAQLGINLFNQAEANSQVAGTLGRLELAGVVAYNLPNGNERQFNIEDDINDLIDDGQAQALRAQFSADLVVLFTDGNYINPQTGGNILGLAGNFDEDFNIGLFDARSYAIVDIDRAQNNSTFIHEVGHLFAMRHQTCAEWNSGFGGCDDGGAFEHGYNFKRRRWPAADRQYSTIMHQIRGDWARIPYFSNPDVSYDTKATGVAGIADNARQLEVADFTVSRYELGGDLTAFIDGPSSVNLYTRYTWESVHSCGDNYTFLWEMSDNGFNYYWAGTTETMSRTVYNSNQDRFYIRLTVTSNGQVETAFRTVYVNNTRYENSKAKDTLAWQEIVEVTEPGEGSILLEEAYPNPLEDKTQIGFYLPKSDIVSLDILTLEGKRVSNVMGGATEAGSYEFTIKRGDLPAGLYFYQLSVGEKRYTRRLVVKE